MSFAGPARGQTLADWVTEINTPQPFAGTPASPAKLALAQANYGFNRLKGGGFESWSGDTSAVPDAWTLTGAGATVARESSTVKEGSYAVKFTAALNTETDIRQSVTLQEADKGRAFTLAVWVHSTVGDRAYLEIDDGVGLSESARHSGSNSFELLTVTRTVDASATQFRIRLIITSGASHTVTWDAAMLVEGDAVVAFSPNPSDAHLRLSNVQSTTPADRTDFLVPRMEVGQANLTGNTSVTTVSKTITFETTFRTLHALWLGHKDAVGGDRVSWRADGDSVSGFTLNADTVDGGNFANTNTGACWWAALGSDA